MTVPGSDGVARRAEEGSGPAADPGEYLVALVLAVLGVFVLVQARGIHQAVAGNNPIGPRLVPFIVGGGLVLVASLLVVDIARGGRGEAESSEDVDVTHGADWPTLIVAVVLFGAAGQLIPMIGFPASGIILFFGMARLLGSRRLVRDVIVSVAVPSAAFVLFTAGLGVYLPVGPR